MKFIKALKYTSILTLQNLVYSVLINSVLLYYITPEFFADIAIYSSINNSLVVLISTGFGSLLLGTKGITAKIERIMFGRLIVTSLVIGLIYFLTLCFLDRSLYFAVIWTLYLLLSSSIVIPKALLYRRKNVYRLMIISFVSNLIGGVTLLVLLLCNFSNNMIGIYLFPLIMSALVTLILSLHELQLAPSFPSRIDSGIMVSSYSLMGGKLISSQVPVISNILSLYVFGAFGLGIVSRAEQFGMILPRLFKKTFGNLGITYLADKDTLSNSYKIKLEHFKIAFFSFYMLLVVIIDQGFVLFTDVIPVQYHPYLDHVVNFAFVSVFSMLNNFELSILKTRNLGLYYFYNEIWKIIPMLVGFGLVYYVDLSYDYYVYIVGFRLMAEYVINHFKYLRLVRSTVIGLVDIWYIFCVIFFLADRLNNSIFIVFPALLVLGVWSLKKSKYGKELV